MIFIVIQMKQITLNTWDIWLESQRRYVLCLLNNKILGVCKSKGHVAQQILLKTRNIYSHCESCNLPQVNAVEVENIWRKPSIYVLGCYWLVEIQSDSLFYGHENEESVSFVSINLWFCG